MARCAVGPAAVSWADELEPAGVKRAGKHGLGRSSGRRSGRRASAGVILALLTLPVIWLRSEPVAGQEDARLDLHRLEAAAPDAWPDGLTALGAWELNSADHRFGGYSALITLPGGRLRAYSDRGASMEFAEPSGPRQQAEFATIAPDPADEGHFPDIEAAQRDAGSGDIWLAYEDSHSVRRFPADGGPVIRAAPKVMQDWPRNGGAEAMVRLSDGRFVILCEKASGYSSAPGPGLLFDGDPVEGRDAVPFMFSSDSGYQPADMALLPDGRVLILLRALKFGWPPFHAALAVADPATIRGGENWQFELLARLDRPLPRDNYEGLAVTTDDAGEVIIWLISDDNNAQLQRTLLVNLRWSGVAATQAETRGIAPTRSD